MKKQFLVLIITIIAVLFGSNQLFAHCDTMDGPVVKDAKKAIDQNNVNYVLKWVLPDDEKEITEAFKLMMKVRSLSPEAKILAEKYFF